MQTTHFKLKGDNGVIRRVSFPSRPAWHVLAAKIEELYAIPIEKVGVGYTDDENEVVTLNREDELHDFYKETHKPGEVIKLTVKDLTAARAQSKIIHEDPLSSTHRNTFGQVPGEIKINIDTEDDWQSLPPFSGLGGIFLPRTPGSTSPHAFVEVLESDVSTVHGHDKDSQTGDSIAPIQSDARSNTAALPDKGKEKEADSDGMSSTASVLAEYAPSKYPVHVFDIGSRAEEEHPSTSAHMSNLNRAPVAAESTPKAAAPVTVAPGINATNIGEVHSDLPEAVADPPLPPLDFAPPTNPSPSLYNDVASLLTTFSDVIVAHPELSEGIRNIISNTSSGTYWAANRDAISRAAEEIVQSTGRTAEELRRNAEEEAARRVADALSGIFRTLSQTLGGNSSTSPDAATSAPGAEESSIPWNVPGVQSGPLNSTSFWYGPSAPGFQSSPGWRNTPPPVHPSFFMNSWLRHRPSFRGGAAWGSPWTPPPANHPRGPPPPVHPHAHHPPPPPPAPVPRGWESQSFGGFPPPPPPPPPHPPTTDSPHETRSPQELRAQVEAARLRYKAEKERYRKEREERKKERERKAFLTSNETLHNNRNMARSAELTSAAGPSKEPVQAARIISNARGSFPQMELVDVPRRSNTHPGRGSSGHRNNADQVTDILTTHAFTRISRRLADMGFTENVYPDLPRKIRVHIPSNGSISKDGEDDVVTTLLEELLAVSPKPRAAPGTGMIDNDIPGAWL